MDSQTKELFANIYATHPKIQRESYLTLLTITEEPVAWTYEILDELFETLRHKDAYIRSIAGQLIANLAKSDPDKKLFEKIHLLFEASKDKKSLKSRNILLSLWKVGIVSAEHKEKIIEWFEKQYQACSKDKNRESIRFDIVCGLRKMYDDCREPSIQTKAMELINLEQDQRAKLKYLSVWRDVVKFRKVERNAFGRAI